MRTICGSIHVEIWIRSAAREKKWLRMWLELPQAFRSMWRCRFLQSFQRERVKEGANERNDAKKTDHEYHCHCYVRSFRWAHNFHRQNTMTRAILDVCFPTLTTWNFWLPNKSIINFPTFFQIDWRNFPNLFRISFEICVDEWPLC